MSFKVTNRHRFHTVRFVQGFFLDRLTRKYYSKMGSISYLRTQEMYRATGKLYPRPEKKSYTGYKVPLLRINPFSRFDHFRHFKLYRH